MKSQVKNFILCVCLVLFTSCALFDSSVKSPNDNKNLEKALQNQEKIQVKNDLIKGAENKLEDKGKSLLHGGRYVLNLSTNKTPEIDVSLRFLDLAQLSLGNPNIKDAQVIEGIADGLLAEYKAENLRLKAAAETNKTEIKKLEFTATQLERQHRDAESQLKTFVGTVNKIQEEKTKLESELKKEQGKNNDLLEQLAVKADRFDAEHNWFSELNPFSSLMTFIKKLFGWGVIFGVLFIVFKVLEVLFPGVSVLSWVISLPIKIISKFVPKAIKTAGYVGDSVWKTLKKTVAANQEFLNELERMPIEDELVENYDDSYKFSKSEVKNLLYKLTENTVKIIKDKLEKNINDDNSRGVIAIAKAETGIKRENLDVRI